MSEHLDGRPVSATTYRHHGCRCDGCRAAATAKKREDRSKRDGALLKVSKRIDIELVKWARAHITPEEREEITERAYAHLGIERRRKGRPRSASRGTMEHDEPQVISGSELTKGSSACSVEVEVPPVAPSPARFGGSLRV